MAVIIRDRSSGTVYSSADKTGRKEEKPRAGGVIITDRATGRTYGSDPSPESPAMALAREAAAERDNPNGYVGMADINRQSNGSRRDSHDVLHGVLPQTAENNNPAADLYKKKIGRAHV